MSVGGAKILLVNMYVHASVVIAWFNHFVLHQYGQNPVYTYM